MKSILIMILALAVCVGAEEFNLPKGYEADPKRPDVDLSFSATRNYYKELSVIQTKYRSRLADALKHADGAEIFLLSFTMDQEAPDGKEDQYFSIKPYKSFSKILARKRLKASDVIACRTATVALLKESDDLDGGAMCHFPIHAIRLFKGEDLIFETSICWKCSNYYLEYPDDFETATWVGFIGKPIQSYLHKAMPIPQSEIDRFDAKYGAKKKKKK